jgi:hypothetical protein
MRTALRMDTIRLPSERSLVFTSKRKYLGCISLLTYTDDVLDFNSSPVSTLSFTIVPHSSRIRVLKTHS